LNEPSRRKFAFTKFKTALAKLEIKGGHHEINPSLMVFFDLLAGKWLVAFSNRGRRGSNSDSSELPAGNPGIQPRVLSHVRIYG
jgi:hypothetical protein